ncbi:MAG TPA: hypothetical protein VG253_28760 [Streptosporangiaceae bacterium]|nr:hypothetical protein [Streptosporangiaceae bacterium]
MATSRRTPPSRPPSTAGAHVAGNAAGSHLAAREESDPPGVPQQAAPPSAGGEAGGPPHRLPPVRLAPREELAAAARVAPLLRAARDIARWVGPGRRVSQEGWLNGQDAQAVVTELELIPAEYRASWRVADATGMVTVTEDRVRAGARLDVLTTGTADEVLLVWDKALAVMLSQEDLDGMATALYTVGAPVRMDELFDAYAAAAGSRAAAGDFPPSGASHADGDPHRGAGGEADQEDESSSLSVALETLADLGVVELGADESATGLTVTLSPLGVWGVHRRLCAQGWHVPVAGDGARGDAASLLATLANCDVEDGEAEITAWLADRSPGQAAAELIEAARHGSPGLRGAGFAVLDRTGADAVPAVREALNHPVLRAHAAVWLHEHGEEAELGREDRAWLLVDLGAGLLEEADPQDVVAELLPDVPPQAQAELVAGLWRVDHPGVTDLLTALSDHHPDPGVARAARKAAFKARSFPAGRSGA